MPAAAAAAETTKGFRFFDLGADGRLLAPFATRYWPDKLTDADVWQPGVNTARCLVSDHTAPAPDCTCGFRATANLADLLEAAERRFARSSRSILDDLPVMAEVELEGRILPGVDVPSDDPPTTSRGERARLVVVYLAPRLSPGADAPVLARYGVPVIPSRTWPPASLVTPEEERPEVRFLAEVRAAGFGVVAFTEDNERILLDLARDTMTMVRKGMTSEDAARTLFDSPAVPTLGQVRTFLNAGLRFLDPIAAATVRTGYEHAAPITHRESISRALLAAMP